MAFWRLGIFSGIIAGLIWAPVWHVIITVGFIISSGISIELQLGPALLTGILVGGLTVIKKVENKLITLIIGSSLTFFSLILFSIGKPFGSELLVYQGPIFIATSLFSVITFFSINNSVGTLNFGLVKKYFLEAFYARLVWGLGLVFLILIVVIPFYVMLMTSLKNQQSLLKNPLDLSIDLTSSPGKLFNSYIELFVEYDFLTLLLNSAFVSIVTVIITLLFSIPGAYAVAKLRFPARQWFSGSILMIYLIPAIILVIPLYSVFSQLGLRNSLLGLCIVYPATTIPVALYMLKGYFSGLPSELDDAGLMDGLTRWQIIIKISIPLAIPAIASVALYVFMIAWNEFLFAFMFLDDIKIFTLSRGIVSLDSTEVPRQHLMAASVVATVPVLFIFLWFEKFLVSGLTSGGVKG